MIILVNIFIHLRERNFIKSNIKKEDINLELKNSKYYFDEPSWKKLIRFFDLEEDNFKTILEDVI